MPVPGLDIDVQDREARELVATIDEDVERGIDDALEDIGQAIRVAMARQLFRQGSVATTEGVSSLRVRDTGRRRKSVVGRRYLLALEHGTSPHTPRSTYRLRFWAHQEGWSTDALVKHIQSEGTDPNPFIGQSVDRAATRLDDITLTNIQKRIDS